MPLKGCDFMKRKAFLALLLAFLVLFTCACASREPIDLNDNKSKSDSVSESREQSEENEDLPDINESSAESSKEESKSESASEHDVESQEESKSEEESIEEFSKADSKSSKENSKTSKNESKSSKEESKSSKIDKNGKYSDKDSVAEYIHTYKKLPSNFISKNDARKAGWDSGKNLWDYCPGKSIGGDYFGNYEEILPSAKGRKWTECDIDYKGGKRNGKRIVFSNDGLIYYTDDHYETFTRLY